MNDPSASIDVPATEPRVPAPSSLWRAAHRLEAKVLLVSLAYYFGAQLGFALTFESVPTSIFWLPNATMLAAFLLAPPRTWWAYVLAVLPAHIAVQAHNAVPPLTMALLFLTNLGDAAAGALAIRHFSRGEPRFDSVHKVVVFMVFAVATPLVMSFLDAGVVVGTGWAHDFWLAWHTRVRSNILTNLIWVPAVVVAVTAGPRWVMGRRPSRYLEAAALAVSLVLVGGFVFASPVGGSGAMAAVLYAPLPLFIWAAARFGLGGVSAALVGFAFLVSFHATRGHGPFANDSPFVTVLTLQVFLTALAATLMLLAALWQERIRTEDAIREDRQRLARDLHDSVIQSLCAGTLMAEALPTLWAHDREKGQRMLTSLHEITSTAVSEMRALLLELRPGALMEVSLGELLTQLVATVRGRIKGSIQLKVDEDVKLPPAVHVTFFRVAQEGLNNAVKHAGARKVEVSLWAAGNGAWLAVQDDGVGFARGDAAEPHLGLKIMRERSDAIRATLVVDSAPQQGTTITLRWAG
jgi:signal transduction histidine kinase